MATKADLELSSKSGGRYFGYVDIVVPPAPPFVMLTNGDDCTVSTKYLREGSFEASSLALWAHLAKTATSIFDIGAHAGIYSLVAASLRPDVQIQAFEPNPDAYARLVMNITANDITNILPHRMGIGDTDGHFHLAWLTKRLGHLSSGAKFIGEDTNTEGGTSVVARMMRLESILKTVTPGERPLMKIDVEGQEERVFKGMGQMLGHRPDIILETFDAEICRRLTDLTQSLGYSYYLIDETAGQFIQRTTLQPGTADSMNQLLTTRPLKAG